jgi:hypothetical protein
MKYLIALSVLIAAAFTAQAQTNIQYRITVDGQNTSWSFDSAGSNKDKSRVAGIIYGYQVYTNSLGTNDVALAMGPWLKRQHLVLVDDYTTQKQSKDNAALAAKLVSLLTANSDLLSNADINALTTIAEKAP